MCQSIEKPNKSKLHDMLRQPFCGLENPNWGFLESKQGKYIINFFILN